MYERPASDALSKRFEAAFMPNYGVPRSRWRAARARRPGTSTAVSIST